MQTSNMSKFVTAEEITMLSSLGILHRLRKDSKIFYVNPDPSIGSDSKNLTGRNFRSPLLTVGNAITKCTSGNGDFILIQSSGSMLDETDVSINKSDITIAAMSDVNSATTVWRSSTSPSTAHIIIGSSGDNLLIQGLGFSGVDTTAISAAGGANNVTIRKCNFSDYAACITTSNGASCANWVIEDCRFYNASTVGITGYLHHGLIRRNQFLNTDNTAWSVAAIKLLDNTTTADSDGCIIKDNLIMGGYSNVMEVGIYVVANVIGVGIINNVIGGLCTRSCIVESGISGQLGNSIIGNYGVDGANGTAEYADAEVMILGTTT